MWNTCKWSRLYLQKRSECSQFGVVKNLFFWLFQFWEAFSWSSSAEIVLIAVCWRKILTTLKNSIQPHLKDYPFNVLICKIACQLMYFSDTIFFRLTVQVQLSSKWTHFLNTFVSQVPSALIGLRGQSIKIIPAHV